MKKQDLNNLKRIIKENPEWVQAFNNYKPEISMKIEAIKTPHRCPVCGGNGLVPNGFYNQTTNQWSTISTIPEQCKSCNGTGVVWN